MNIKCYNTIPLFLITLITNCVHPLDYYGNNINLKEENIYLSDLRDQKNDKFLLIFKGRYNQSSKSDMFKRKRALERYTKLIKNFYGYTESQILDEESFGIISPRYYVTIQFK